MKRLVLLLFVLITACLYLTGCNFNSTFQDLNQYLPISSSHVEKVSASDISMKNSTEQRSLDLNEWGRAMCYTGSNPEYSEVGVMITEVIRGDEAVKILKKAGYKSSEINEPLIDNNEWMVLKYKVYCPENFPINDYGFFYTLISIRVDYYSGIYRHSGFGTDISNYDAGENYKADYIYNGEVGEGLSAFSVSKDAKEIQIRFGSDSDFSNDTDKGFAYFTVK